MFCHQGAKQQVVCFRLHETFQANSLVANEVTAALNPTELSSFMSLFSIKIQYFKTKNAMELNATFLLEGEVRCPSLLCLRATRYKMVNDTVVGHKARSYGITGWKRPPRSPSPTTTNPSPHPETESHTHQKAEWGSVLKNIVSPQRFRCLCYIPLLQSNLK